MGARVPQDVDLEDRLIFGLSPLRFGYLVIGALAALSLWRVAGVPGWLRAVPCLLLVGGAAGLAWGRWQGRAVDRWVIDLAVFVGRNYRVGRHGRGRRRRRGADGVLVPLRAINAITRDGCDRDAEARVA
ncbi:MAG TPA: PrgI family protein [Candidatus Dormibacteraeota bacterium]|nr:PrgI family protein [Candidatus Dormibacteraeota bacterium]